MTHEHTHELEHASHQPLGLTLILTLTLTLILTLNLTRHGVRRVVLASSNHVMGGYKDLPGTEGDVTPASPPRCGLYPV